MRHHKQMWCNRLSSPDPGYKPYNKQRKCYRGAYSSPSWHEQQYAAYNFNDASDSPNRRRRGGKGRLTWFAFLVSREVLVTDLISDLRWWGLVRYFGVTSGEDSV